MAEELPVVNPPKEWCEWCGENEIRQKGVGRRRRYCSGKCRQQASIARRADKAARAAEKRVRAELADDGPAGP
jgi:hypothetical protein